MVLLDITMPKSCSECPLFDDSCDYPTCYVNKISRGYTFNSFVHKMDTCPLKEFQEKNEKIKS